MQSTLCNTSFPTKKVCLLGSPPKPKSQPEADVQGKGQHKTCKLNFTSHFQHALTFFCFLKVTKCLREREYHFLRGVNFVLLSPSPGITCSKKHHFCTTPTQTFPVLLQQVQRSTGTGEVMNHDMMENFQGKGSTRIGRQQGK